MVPARGGHKTVCGEVFAHQPRGWRKGEFLLVKKRDFSPSQWLKSHGGCSSVGVGSLKSSVTTGERNDKVL